MNIQYSFIKVNSVLKFITLIFNITTLLYFCFNHIISIFFTLYSKVHLNIRKK